MVAVRTLLDPMLGDHHPFIFIVFAILLTARFGGWKPAVFAMMLGMLVALHQFVPERGSFVVTDPKHQTGLIIYLLVCSACIALSESERAARKRAVRKADALEDEVVAHQRTQEALLRVNQILSERAAQAASSPTNVLRVSSDADRPPEADFVAMPMRQS
jgi:K+-sensing histidine kinase KdpD